MMLITSDLEVLRQVVESGLDAFLASAVHQAAVERYLERVRAHDRHRWVVGRWESGSALPLAACSWCDVTAD
jgi:hypothetical protein